MMRLTVECTDQRHAAVARDYIGRTWPGVRVTVSRGSGDRKLVTIVTSDPTVIAYVAINVGSAGCVNVIGVGR